MVILVVPIKMWAPRPICFCFSTLFELLSIKNKYAKYQHWNLSLVEPMLFHTIDRKLFHIFLKS